MDDAADPWDAVPGWYDWEPFYAAVVDTAPPGSTVVEVGVFCGKSLVHLSRLAKASGKNLRVVGVDTFRGSEEHAHGLSHLPAGTLAANCVDHLSRCGVLGDVVLLVTDSVTAATFFDDGSLHAVFIDAAHDRANVEADISAWRGKVRHGGLLGGHDYHTFPDVKAVVDERFPGIEVAADRSWWEVSL